MIHHLSKPEIKKTLGVILILFFSTVCLFGQEVTLRGKVTAAIDNEPLPGATVSVINTVIGTTTDIDGNFALIVPSNAKVLVVSFVGMETQEIEIGDKRNFSIVLEESSEMLDEVVAVAFGTQKKTDLVGSVTSLTPSELRVPASNLTTALAGQAAGVISYQLTGEPGRDNAQFFIRGVTSFGTGKVDPLILIDGVELGVTEMARLRPDDIESFSIFKDATSTALYGARGANGVIYIVTKQGKEGKPKINFRAEGSLSTATQNIELRIPSPT